VGAPNSWFPVAGTHQRAAEDARWGGVRELSEETMRATAEKIASTRAQLGEEAERRTTASRKTKKGGGDGNTISAPPARRGRGREGTSSSPTIGNGEGGTAMRVGSPRGNEETDCVVTTLNRRERARTHSQRREHGSRERTHSKRGRHSDLYRGGISMATTGPHES